VYPPRPPIFFCGLGFYLSRIDCWRSDSSYLSVFFEKNCSKDRNLSIFLPIFNFMFYAYSECLYIKNIFLNSLLVGKPFLRSKAAPQPRSPPPKIVSAARLFVNFDSGFCDSGWFELSSHRAFTFDNDHHMPQTFKFPPHPYPISLNHLTAYASIPYRLLMRVIRNLYGGL